jgi:hypothetical protein
MDTNKTEELAAEAAAADELEAHVCAGAGCCGIVSDTGWVAMRRALEANKR